jgi:tetratricopeptide (TPR) repeat protein
MIRAITAFTLLLAAGGVSRADLPEEVEARLRLQDTAGALELLDGRADEVDAVERHRLRAEVLAQQVPVPLEAIESELLAAFDADPSTPADLVELGVQLRDAGRLDRAEAILYRGLSRFPDHPRLLQVLGTVRSRRGEVGPGARLLQKADDLLPDDPGIRRDLGLALAEAGMQGRALVLLVEARDRAPDDLPVRQALAGTYGTVGDRIHAAEEERSITRLDAFRRQTEERTEALRGLSERIAALEARAGEGAPPPGLFVELRELYRRRKDVAWNMPRLRRLAAGVEGAEAAGARALAAAELGDAEEAQSALEAALEMDAADPLALEACVALARGGGLVRDEATSRIRSGIEAAPEAVVPRHLLGRALALARDATGAIQAYRKALALDPEYVPSAVDLATVFYSLGRVDEANVVLGAAAEAAPDAAEVFLALGVSALVRGEVPAASLHLTRAFVLGAIHPRLFRALGELATRRGDPSLAFAFYRLALEEAPDDPELLRWWKSAR